MKLYLRKQLLITACVYIGQLTIGYVQGWPSNMIIKLQDPEQTPLPDVLTDAQSSLVVSLIFVGLIGPYITGYLSHARGRKWCVIFGAICNVIAFLLLALANNLALIYTGRIFAGLSTAIVYISNLVYIGEISSTNIRGILLVGTGIFTSIGLVLAYATGPFVSFSACAYIGLALSVMFLVGSFFIPESPLFYIVKGQEDKATNILTALGRENDVKEILSTIENRIGIKQALTEIYSVKSNRKGMIITLTLMILQQLSGVLVVLFYATSIFDLVDSSLESHVSTIIIGLTQLVASCLTPLFIERSGRRILLLITTAVCCLSLTLLGTYFYLDSIDHSSTETLHWLPVVSLMGFLLSYNFGFGIIPGTFTAEMFDSNVRSFGSVICVTFSWLAGFGVSFTYTLMISSWGGHVTFWAYAVMCALAFLFTAVYVPETKGKSLIEIQELLSK